MSPLQDGKQVEVLGDGETWIVDSWPFMVHNSHVQSEVSQSLEPGTESGNCPVCEGNLSQVATRIEEVKPAEIPGYAVDKGDRTDKEETVPSPSDNAPAAPPWWP